MKRKTSLILNIASLCLCIGALVVGVLSAKAVSVQMSGSVSFVAYNTKVSINGKIEGARINNTSGVYYMQSSGSPTTTNSNIEIDGASASVPSDVSFGSLSFDYDTSGNPKNIVFTFAITNNSLLDITAAISLKEINLDSRINYSADEYMIKIKKGEKGTIKVTLSVSGTEAITATSNSSKIKFTFQSYNVPTLSQAGFSVSSGVLYSVPTGQGELVIPAYFDNGSGELIRINKIGNEGGARAISGVSVYANGTYTGYSSVVISEGITTIGDNAFNGAYTVTSVTIPNSVTSIETSAFAVMSNMQEITIPRSVNFIGSGAFSNWSSTKTIKFEATGTWEKSYVTTLGSGYGDQTFTKGENYSSWLGSSGSSYNYIKKDAE